MSTRITRSRSFLVGLIQWDREWFEGWVADHPLPFGVEVVLIPGQPLSSEVA